MHIKSLSLEKGALIDLDVSLSLRLTSMGIRNFFGFQVKDEYLNSEAI